MLGISGCFHIAAILHLIAVAKWATSLFPVLESPGHGLFRRNSHGSGGIARSKILWIQCLISSHKDEILGQDHSMCNRSADSPHCFGHSGEYPGTNLDNLSGVRYHLINTLYAFSIKVVQMELLAAASSMADQSSSSSSSPRSASH
ncbi:hypothetical protein FKM82_017213 [Ascaphus truei]